MIAGMLTTSKGCSMRNKAEDEPKVHSLLFCCLKIMEQDL